MTTEPIRWGVLGASSFARGATAPAIHAARGCTLAAIATRDPAKADPFAAFAPGLRVHDDYDALLADRDVDAVYIPLPHDMHVPWGIKALEAGKHALIEKPLALGADDIAPLIHARDRTGLQCAEAFMVAHHPQWAHVRGLLADGAIGRLRHVEGRFAYNNADDPGNIRQQARHGGGALPDVGVYVMGATRLATGAEPEAITSAVVDWEAGCDVLARIGARFPTSEGGFTAHWLVGMRLARTQGMTFHGEAGEIRVATPFTPPGSGEARVDLVAGREARTWRWPGVAQYVLQMEAFAAAIRGEAAFPWTLEDARGTQRAIDMAYAAAGGRPAVA